jgi:hypothetical protein
LNLKRFVFRFHLFLLIWLLASRHWLLASNQRPAVSILPLF